MIFFFFFRDSREVIKKLTDEERKEIRAKERESYEIFVYYIYNILIITIIIEQVDNFISPSLQKLYCYTIPMILSFKKRTLSEVFVCSIEINVCFMWILFHKVLLQSILFKGRI